MSGWVWRIPGVLMVLLLSACAATGPVRMYEGPERPVSELALVNVPSHIEVMAIDGREPPGNFLRNGQQLLLLPGEHVFSLRYVQLFQITADDHEVVRSRQAALRFRAEAGGEYRLESPPQPNRDAARQFAKAPEFTLVSVRDSAVAPIESTPIQSYAEASLIDTISKAFNGAAEGEAPRQVTNVDLLKDIWGRSSPQEKTAFSAWLKEQGQ